MSGTKYPLKPLLDHRERAVDSKTAELGGAIRARESAADAKDRAKVSQDAAEAAAAKVRFDEAARLANGELRAGDLARGQAWEIGAQRELAAHAKNVATANEKLTAAKTGESAARSSLANAMADRDVVAKDEARFDAKAKAKALAAEEEQAEEAYRGKRC